MQTFEYEGKNYVLAEEYIKENRKDERLESAEFSPSKFDLDYYEYLDVDIFTEMTDTIEEDVSTLNSATEIGNEYFEDNYRVLLEVDENNHVTGSSDLFLNLATNEIVDSQIVFDEFVNRIEDVENTEIESDYNSDTDRLYKQLENHLNDIQADNMNTAVRIADSEIALTEYKENGKNLDELIEGFEKIIADKVIDVEKERLQSDYQNIGFGEDFVKNLKGKFFEDIDKDPSLNSYVERFDSSLLDENFKDRNEFVLETCINTAVDNKKDDLIHYSEMERMEQVMEEAVYEDVKEELENEDFSLA